MPYTGDLFGEFDNAGMLVGFRQGSNVVPIKYIAPLATAPVRDVNVHGLRVAEPMMQLDLPSPYYPSISAAKEHAYGTPIYFATGFQGWHYWMVGAPYPTTEALPGGAAKYENPCIYVSNDGEKWSVPTGMANPIADGRNIPPNGGADTNSYYADPYITVSSDLSTLYVVWLWTNRTGTIKHSLLLSESKDGVTWSTPTEIYQSTLTTFCPNSPSLFWTGSGWTIMAVDTRDGTGVFTICRATTSSPTPYSGWSAFANCTAAHPLGRRFWHAHFLPLDGGVVIGLASDNNAAGGTAWSLKSTDSMTFTVQPFSYKQAAAGGTWYRPSLCICDDGTNRVLRLYTSRIGPFQQPGFWIQTAKLADDLALQVRSRALLRELVQRQASAAAKLTLGLLEFDSFNRADSIVTPGNSENGQAWNIGIGTLGISTNRLYNVGAGNNIATLDLKSVDYDYELTIGTLDLTGGGEAYLIWNYVDVLNFFRLRLDNFNLQVVVAGAVVQTYTNGGIVSTSAGDLVRLVRQGNFHTVWWNDRPYDTIRDTRLSTATRVGVQLAATAQYIDQVVIALP